MTQNKIEAGWMDPVATKLETMQFDVFHVSSADAEKLRLLPVGAELYTLPPDADLLRAQLVESKAEIERLRQAGDGPMCADCRDTGWMENRVKGRYPCVCIAETEPYQLLQSEVERLRGYQKDAGRYRKWKWHFREGMCELFNALNKASTDEEHDAAIDAARAEIGSGST